MIAATNAKNLNKQFERLSNRAYFLTLRPIKLVIDKMLCSFI